MLNPSRELTRTEINNPCTAKLWCQDPKNILITIVAIAALGAVIVGVLTLLASSHASLSGLNALGMPGGVSFIIGGSIALILMASSAFYFYQRQDSTPNSKPEAPKEDVVQPRVDQQSEGPNINTTSLERTQENAQPEDIEEPKGPSVVLVDQQSEGLNINTTSLERTQENAQPEDLKEPKGPSVVLSEARNQEIEQKSEPVLEKPQVERTSSMSYALDSHKGLEAATSQYKINTQAPVQLTLSGPHSYCYLKAIGDPKLKETLSTVGIAYEQTKHNAFFNFSHTFTPTTKNESFKTNDNQVLDIFDFVNSAVNTQTNGKLMLDLADMTKLVVKTAEDRSIRPSLRAYELSIGISEEAVATAEKSGLVFRKYGPPPEGYPEDVKLYAVHVGQTGIR